MIDFRILLGVLLLQGTLSRSIHNGTIDESKFITTDMFDARMKNMTDLVTSLIEKHEQDNRKHVFFYARTISSDFVLNTNSIVKFSDVLNNNGNHFNSCDSIFIAPVSGVYMFSWTTQTSTAKAIQTELRVNNVVKEVLTASIGSSSGNLPFTRVVVCPVKKDYHVWIQTGSTYSENYFDLNHDSRSSFMGILMYGT